MLLAPQSLSPAALCSHSRHLLNAPNGGGVHCLSVNCFPVISPSWFTALVPMDLPTYPPK